ncbi:MAG: hypothetical protein ACI4ED_04850 [Suilimivivens sp.]
MKTNPKTKHSKKFIEEKNKLISKAVFNRKLDTIRNSICEYLKDNPINITCGDIKDEFKYTVFISVSNGKSRARVCHASASDFESSWEKVCEKINMVIDKYKITPVWVKADIVDFVQRIFYPDIKDAFLSAKYRNFFRMGFSLDPRMDLAFLEAEANSYGLYDYSVIPMKASKPGHENVPCINIERVAEYLEWNDRKTIPLILPYTYFFNCKCFFMDADKEVYTLYDAGIHCGRRITEELSSDFVKEILTTSSQYLNRQMLQTNKFIYGYFPSFNAVMTSYNILRHTGTLWSMMCAYEVTKDNSLIETVNKAIDYLLTQIKYKDEETAFVVEEKSKEIKLGGNGIAIIALSKHMEVFGDRDFTEIISKLANGILSLQDKNTGKMTHVLYADNFEVKEAFRTVYYDGESSYALVKAYDISGDVKYLDAARLSIDYFIEKDYVVYRDHWLAYAMNEFTKFVHEDKYFTFALRNAWENREKIRKQQTSYHTYLELMLETYDIYLRMKKDNISVDYMNQIDEAEFVDIIKYRAFHMLDGYFYPEYAMYMERPDKILGSFFVRHDDFRARIDDNQHFIDGYAKYYKLILGNKFM